MAKKKHFVSLLLFHFVSNMKSITVTMVVSLKNDMLLFFELVPLKETFGKEKKQRRVTWIMMCEQVQA